MQVNDVDISEASHNEAVQVLSNAGDTVKMIILRETEELAQPVTENGEEEPKPEATEVRTMKLDLYLHLWAFRYFVSCRV